MHILQILRNVQNWDRNHSIKRFWDASKSRSFNSVNFFPNSAFKKKKWVQPPLVRLQRALIYEILTASHNRVKLFNWKLRITGPERTLEDTWMNFSSLVLPLKTVLWATDLTQRIPAYLMKFCQKAEIWPFFYYQELRLTTSEPSAKDSWRRQEK